MSDIVIIGGINIDIEGRPRQSLRMEDSNPGEIKISFGGVGRNIAENLARLGSDVSMISFTGDDFLGRDAANHLQKIGVNVDNVQRVDGQQTGIYLSVLTDKNDMSVGICNMDILQNINQEFIASKLDVLNSARLVSVDCNLTLETLSYITRSVRVPLFLETISASKCEKVRDIIGEFDIIKPNRIEAEVLCGFSITSEEDIKRAGKWFIDRGVKQVYISLGEQGLYYRTGECEGMVAAPKVNVNSATGAGDSCAAAVIYGHINGFDEETTSKLAVSCAAMTLESASAVNDRINLDTVKRMAGI